MAVGAGSVWVVYGDSTLSPGLTLGPLADFDATYVGASRSGCRCWERFRLGRQLRRLDRDSSQPEDIQQVGPPIRVGRRPVGIAFGEGAVWVADKGADAVTRIDPLTDSTKTIPVGAGAGPTAVAAGGGLVWVANTAAGTVSRIDPVRNEVVETINVGNAPSGIAFGGDAVWVAVQAP